MAGDWKTSNDTPLLGRILTCEFIDSNNAFFEKALCKVLAPLYLNSSHMCTLHSLKNLDVIHS